MPVSTYSQAQATLVAMTIWTKNALLAVGALLVLSACDGLNFSTARAAEQAENEGVSVTLIELSDDDIRPPLDREIASQGLPIPGAVRPLGPAPDIRQIERDLFKPYESSGTTITSYSLTFSQAELDLLNRTGARRTNPAIRDALTPAPGLKVPAAPLTYSAEVHRLAQAGIRMSSR